MVDWTVVITTLGAAGLTGGFAYAAARWQGRVALESVRAENERLRIQHREEHLRNRQTTYHRFLDATATFDRMRLMTNSVYDLGETSEEAKKHLDDLNATFRNLLNGVVLFGAEPVRRAAQRLDRLHDEITAEWWANIKAVFDAGAERERLTLGRAFRGHRLPEWDEAHNELVDAMRADVAPSLSTQLSTRLG